jgi:hypothetical protein
VSLSPQVFGYCPLAGFDAASVAERHDKVRQTYPTQYKPIQANTSQKKIEEVKGCR